MFPAALSLFFFSCVNPILYAFLSDNFRKAFHAILPAYCCCFFSSSDRRRRRREGGIRTGNQAGLPTYRLKKMPNNK